MTVYLAGHTCGPNCSIWHCFQDKCIFGFYAEIKGSHPKMEKKVAGDSGYTLQTTNLVQIVLFYTISKFQDECIVDFMQKFKKPNKHFCRYSAEVT